MIDREERYDDDDVLTFSLTRLSYDRQYLVRLLYFFWDRIIVIMTVHSTLITLGIYLPSSF
jgi:hypothetical protein